MARNYSANTNSTNTATSTQPCPIILSAATVQPGIYEINSGSGAAPANAAVRYHVARATAIGTVQSEVTFQALDPGAGTAVAAVTRCMHGSSPLATFATTVGVLVWAQNQNTAYRWVASSPTRMIKLPSTTSAGVGFLPVAVGGSAGPWDHTISVTIEE